MKRKEAKAEFVRGAEEIFEEMWKWGESLRRLPLMRSQMSWRLCGAS